MHLKSRFGFEAHRDLSKHMFLSALAWKLTILLRLQTDRQGDTPGKSFIVTGFKCVALLWRRAVRHYRSFEAFRRITEPDFSPIYSARLLMTQTRRFLTQFAKSQKQRNTRANYAFKKWIRIRSASRPIQAYVLIRSSLKTHHFITATDRQTDRPGDTPGKSFIVDRPTALYQGYADATFTKRWIIIITRGARELGVEESKAADHAELYILLTLS